MRAGAGNGSIEGGGAGRRRVGEGRERGGREEGLDRGEGGTDGTLMLPPNMALTRAC